MRWSIVLLFITWPAMAGAWTEHRGHVQFIASFTSSTASLSFDKNGHPTIPAAFKKMSTEIYTEYGLNSAVTLLFTPTFVIADFATSGGRIKHSNSVSLEGGGRLLLYGRAGQLSVQATYKTAGAFAMSVSADHEAGRQIDTRLLYGTNFRLLRSDWFVDLEAGERFIDRPRPDEAVLDITAGLWVTPRTMIMAQSFNIVSGDATAPYSRYRTHKLEFSVVQKLTHRWSLQSSAFFSPAGQNALDESGMSVALWAQL